MSKAHFATLTMVSMENPITNCLQFFFRTDGICFTSQCWDTFQLRSQRFAMQNSSIRLKEKLSEMVKLYNWFISKGVNFDA